jgi:Transposase DDE domain group 1
VPGSPPTAACSPTASWATPSALPRLSCHAFRHNAVRLQPHALAYNLANFMRTLALPEEVEHWSLTTLRAKLVKISARIVRHGRYVVFQLAEVAVPRALFADILRRIDRLSPRPLLT